MKTSTVKGTKVEIVGLTGCNLVTVKVAGRDSTAQVNANDLNRPEGDLPEELAELKFYDPTKAIKPIEDSVEDTDEDPEKKVENNA